MLNHEDLDLTHVELELPPHMRKNELHPRLLGTAVGLNPFVSTISPSRLQMFTSHLGQMPVIEGATVRLIQSGAEREYGKYVFNRKIERESRVIEYIPRFRGGITEFAVNYNPCTTLVLGTSDEDGNVLYDLLELDDHHIMHQSYGYRFKNTPAYQMIAPDMVFPDNTILKQSPNVTEHGDWTYGTETNVAFMSVPAIIEDGIRASESFCKKASFTAIKKAVAQCGGRFVPLNLYGDDRHYKPFPDVGEPIADHGMIMALRRFDPMMAPVNMTPKALRRIDYAFDRPIRGKAGAIITDVDVWFGGQHRNMNDRLPVGMEVQFEKYNEQHRQYFDRLVGCYYRLKKMCGGMEPPLSPRFQRKLVEAYARLGKVPNGHKLQFTYKQTPVDDWRIEFTYQYTLVPTIGFKVTDTHGGDKISGTHGTSINVV